LAEAQDLAYRLTLREDVGEAMRRKRRVVLAVASAWLLAPAATFAWADDCRPLAPDVEVDGEDLQPTPGEVKERLAEDGCTPSAAEEAAEREQTEEVNQLYRQLESETERDQEGAAAEN
jgi:hypothetical protein